MMPEMNGFDVAAVLKNDPQTMDIPIVILSIVQDRERGFRLGVDRYLTKPIDTDLLFKEVGELIEQKKSHKHVLVVDDDASTVKTLDRRAERTRATRVAEARADDLVEPGRAAAAGHHHAQCRGVRAPDAVRCCASRRAWRTFCSSSISKEPAVDRKILIVDDEAHLRIADPADARGARRRGRRAAHRAQRRRGARGDPVDVAESRVSRRDDAEAEWLRRLQPRQA